MKKEEEIMRGRGRIEQSNWKKAQRAYQKEGWVGANKRFRSVVPKLVSSIWLIKSMTALQKYFQSYLSQGSDYLPYEIRESHWIARQIDENIYVIISPHREGWVALVKVVINGELVRVLYKDDEIEVEV